MGYDITAGYGKVKHDDWEEGDDEYEYAYGYEDLYDEDIHWSVFTPRRLEVEANERGWIRPTEPLIRWNGCNGEVVQFTDDNGDPLSEMLWLEAFVLRAKYCLDGEIPPERKQGEHLSTLRALYDMMKMCEWMLENADKPNLRFRIG